MWTHSSYCNAAWFLKLVVKVLEEIRYSVHTFHLRITHTITQRSTWNLQWQEVYIVLNKPVPIPQAPTLQPRPPLTVPRAPTLQPLDVPWAPTLQPLDIPQAPTLQPLDIPRAPTLQPLNVPRTPTLQPLNVPQAPASSHCSTGSNPPISQRPTDSNPPASQRPTGSNPPASQCPTGPNPPASQCPTGPNPPAPASSHCSMGSNPPVSQRPTGSNPPASSHCSTGSTLDLESSFSQLPTTTPTLHEGATFATFAEFETAQRIYEQTNYCKLYTRRSRTVESALKRTLKKTFDAKIKFSELEMCCIHGGKKFKSSSSGKRPNQM